jgi:hypothetical protein
VFKYSSVYLLRPKTKKAEKWLRRNIAGETTWFGGGLAIEARYLEDVLDGIRNIPNFIKQFELIS